MKVTEISKKIERSKSTTTTLVNKLANSGYVEKINSDLDKRSVDVFLTKKGEEVKDIISDISQEVLSIVYKGVSDDEKESALTVLEKIVINLKK